MRLDSSGAVVEVAQENLGRLNNRILFSCLAVIFGTVVAVANLYGHSTITFLVCTGICILLIAAQYFEIFLLTALVLRPLLVTLPELQIGELLVGIDGIVNIALIAMVCIALPFQSHLPYKRSVTIIYALFLFSCLVSLPLSMDPLLGGRQLMRFFSYLLFFAAAYSLGRNGLLSLNTLMKTVVALTILLLVMGLAQILFLFRHMSPIEYVRLMVEGELEFRLNGFQAYPHLYGNLAVFCMSTLLAFAWAETSRRNRVALFMLVICTMIAAVVTGVRSVIIALAVVLIVQCTGSKKFTQLFCLIAVAAVLGFASGIFQARLSAFTDPTRVLEWNSLQDRKEIWNVLDIAISQRPWRGYGLGSVYLFVSSSPLRHSVELLSSHCDFRKFQFEAGIVAGVTFPALWIAAGLTAIRDGRKANLQYIGSAFAGITAGFLTIALVDEIFQDYVSMSILWYSLGAFLGTCSNIGSGTPPAQSKYEVSI